MKKKALFLSALACALFTFSACGDDDEDTTDWSKVVPTEAIAVGNGVTATLNGEAVASGNIAFTVGSGNTATLALDTVIPGYAQITVPVTLSKSSDNSYSFTGSTDVSDAPAMLTRDVDRSSVIYNIGVNGTIVDGKCTVSITSQLDASAQGDLVGTWKLLEKGTPASDGSGYTSASLMMTWSAIDATKPNMQTIASLASAFGSPVLFNLLQDVTFNADGNITATYYALQDGESVTDFMNSYNSNEDGTVSYSVVHKGEWQKSTKNLAFWYAKNGYIFVSPNLNAITAVKGSEWLELDETALAQYGLDAATVKAAFEQWNKTGIPLKYTISGNNLSVYVDKEMAAPFVQMLIPTLPALQKAYEQMATEDPQTAQMIQLMFAMIGSTDVDFTQIGTIWNENTKDFGLSLNFTK